MLVGSATAPAGIYAASAVVSARGNFAATDATLAARLLRAVGAPVLCLSPRQWDRLGIYPGDVTIDGYTDLDRGVVVVRRWVCRTVARWRQMKPVRLVEAVHTLAHERYHVLGVLDEDVADCEGARTVPLVARRLGIRVKRWAIREYLRGSPIAGCYPLEAANEREARPVTH